jgi:hypothetical protein
MRAVDAADAAAAAAALAPALAQPQEQRGFNFGWLILAAVGIAAALIALFLYAPH